jgi:hypothetical protein
MVWLNAPVSSTLRRPSHVVLLAAVASIFLIFQLLPLHGASTTFGSAHGARGFARLGDINNATLGVSCVSACSPALLTCRSQFQKIYAVGLPSRTDRRDAIILSAALTNMAIDFIDGVMGDTVLDKAVPASEEHRRLPDPSIGSWRGHINAIQESVPHAGFQVLSTDEYGY